MLVDKSKLELSMARNCWNKVKLAEKAGIPYQSVKRSVMCEGTNPETVGKIAKALGVDPAEIIKEEE
ncbi:helix-turn-helix domain-containing protein [Eubacterium aggregans]|uniref:helix-turn-helix domain-containing protein n=1 Tax=Eubacterium aggregans TaxID=81409 RepID=UPI003F35F97B